MSEEDEVRQLTARVWKTADSVTELEKSEALLNARVTSLEAAIGKGATSYELSSSMTVLVLKIEASDAATKAALQPLQRDVETIKKALYAFVGIVLASVLAAVLALVLR